jgi:hypothetical protein
MCLVPPVAVEARRRHLCSTIHHICDTYHQYLPVAPFLAYTPDSWSPLVSILALFFCQALPGCKIFLLTPFSSAGSSLLRQHHVFPIGR